jgi:ribulose-phosphate 3-epimerase
MQTHEERLDFLKQSLPAIGPSMLKCDFGNLHREMELLHRAQTRVLHLDVMDGHFVPNLSYGPMVIERLRERSRTFFDAHLMISNPQQYLDEYVRVGCDGITVHVEAVPEPTQLLREIRSRGLVAGIAVNPDTEFERVAPFLEEADLFLVMSVQPGFGGQKFLPHVVSKIQAARETGPQGLVISVDGGIGKSTISQCAAAGCDLFVAGSSVFDQPCYSEAMSELRQLAMDAQAV